MSPPSRALFALCKRVKPARNKVSALQSQRLALTETRINTSLFCFSSLNLLEAISDLDVAAIQRITNNVQDVTNGSSGIRQIANQVDHPWYGTSKGAVAHLLTIAEVTKRANHKLKGIEVSQSGLTLTHGTTLPGLRVDLQIELPSGKVIDVELKNYSAKNLKSNIRTLLSEKATSKKTDIDNDVIAGQLMNQLVRYINNGYEGRRLWFTPDCIPDYGKLSPDEKLAKIAETREEISDVVMDYFKENQDDIAKRYFGLSDLSDEFSEDFIKWESILFDLRESLTNKSSANNAFIDILKFENLL